MKVLEEDKDRTVIEFSTTEKELIDCLFLMISADDSPYWGATDVGLGGPRLDEEKFDALLENWMLVRNYRPPKE